MHRLGLTLLIAIFPVPLFAADVRVGPGDDIQAAIDQAMPGDTVTVGAGTYDVGELSTARDGQPDAPITVVGDGDVTLQLASADSRLLDVQHAYFVLESVTLDAGFRAARVMRVDDGATGFVMRDVEARNAARHCVDIRNTSDVLVEGSLIHHCLFWDGGREDAHGISAQGVQRLTIRDTEVHSFTGDALQVDPGRTEPGWDDVVVEGCTFWLGPIDDGSGGVPAGTVPGENAIDTKTADGAVGTLTIRNTTAHGFRGGVIGNMAAYNLKEDVKVIADGLTVFDSEIAFRIRGRAGFGAQPELTNIVVWDVDKALRLEAELQADIPLRHVTFGRDIGEIVETAGGADAGRLDIRNVVVLGPVPASLPGAIEAADRDFESVAGDDYVPASAASWLDAGEDFGVAYDRRGAMRPQGAGPDPGAYERGEAPGEDAAFPGADMGSSDAGRSNNSNPASDAGPGNSGDISMDVGILGAGDSGSAGPAAAEAAEDGCQCSSGSGPGRAAWLLILMVVGSWLRRSRNQSLVDASDRRRS